MHEGTVECLIWAAEGAGSADALFPLLAERGIRVTQAARPQDGLDLLDTRSWLLLIVDASGDTPGLLDMLAQARRIYPDVPAVVLVKQGDVAMAVRAMKADAATCLETPIQAAPLLSVIAALRGQENRQLRDLRAGLTRVERIVLSHILDGQTNRQIAGALNRSPRTVEVHRRHVMRKLGAGTLIDLVKQAIQSGVVDYSDGQAGTPVYKFPRRAQASPERRQKDPSALTAEAS